MIYIGLCGEDFNRMRGYATPPPTDQGEGFGRWREIMETHHTRFTGWMTELCEQYQPDAFWFDGWPGISGAITQAGLEPLELYDFERLTAPVRRLCPGCLISNKRLYGLHTDFLESEKMFHTHQGERLDAFDAPVESCDTLPGSQWFAKTEHDPPMPDDATLRAEITRYLHRLIACAGRGINDLLDTGPLPSGKLQSHDTAVLAGMGRWLERFGHTLYGTRRSRFVPGRWGYALDAGQTTYLHLVDTRDMMQGLAAWRFHDEEGSFLKVGLPPTRRVELNGLNAPPVAVTGVNTGQDLPHTVRNHALAIDMTALELDPVDTIIAIRW